MRSYLFLLVLGFSVHATAQSGVSIALEQNFTNYHYTTSDGERDTSYNPNFSSAFNVGYRFSMEEGVYFTGKIGLRKAGASYVFDDFNYRWDLHYSEFRLGVGYTYDLGPISAHFALQGYTGYLFKAEQRLHHLERDMLAAGTVKEWDHGLIFTPGVAYGLSEKIDLELDFNYLLGLTNIETDDAQKTMNRSMGASVGLAIQL